MEELKFGYARVSTSTQCLDIQVKRLKELDVDDARLFTDKKSGKNNEREGLQELCATFEALSKAKVKNIHLYITKMDRLGRSTLDMLDLIKQFDAWGVKVYFMDDNVSTGNAYSEMVLTILSAVATAERKRILERTNEGRTEAMLKGVKFGAKVKIDSEQVKKIKLLKDSGMGAQAIANEIGISRASVYRVLDPEKYAPKKKTVTT